MPKTFSYTARTLDGKKRAGTIQAEDSARVAVILSEQQLIPTEIKSQKSLGKRGLFGLMESRTFEELIIFTRNLATLFRAGIPILRSLSIIKIGDSNSYFNQVIKEIRDNVQSGRALSDSMADFPKIFPQIYSASIAAGEYSGKLDLVLESLGVVLEKDLELHRQIKSSLRYPIMVVSAIAAAFIVLLVFVIPRFMHFYSMMGAELPLPTQMMIWMNHIVTNYALFIVVGIIALIFLLKKIYSTSAGRRFFDLKFLQAPIFGDLIIKGSVARLSYMFQILIKSGLPIVKSLDMLADVIKNSVFSNEVRLLGEAFREGKESSILSGKMVFFPEMALQMIMVGLESGALEKMLEEIATHYSREVDYKSRQLASLLEPILTVVLGIFVLVVALAIFKPKWNLIQLFRG
jgi:type II secretory pathway component PulF